MAFGAFKDAGERQSLNRERTQRKQQESVGQWQYVNAVFTTANTDLEVNHSLNVTDPESVRYQVVRQSSNAVVYEDLSPTRLPWLQGVIRLRASIPTNARLLLFAEADNPLSVASAASSGPGASGTGTALVSGPAGATSGDLASFNGATGELLQDSGILAAHVVQGPSVTGIGDIATWNNATGTLLADGGFPFMFISLGTGNFNDALAHNIATIANKAGVLWISSSAGTSHLPFYSNGGAGVGFTLTILNPTVGWVINSAAVSFSFTDSSSTNTYKITYGFGNGIITVQRTAGAASYTATAYGA